MVSGNVFLNLISEYVGHVTAPNKIIRSGDRFWFPEMPAFARWLQTDPANEQQISIPITNIHGVNVKKP